MPKRGKRNVESIKQGEELYDELTRRHRAGHGPRPTEVHNRLAMLWLADQNWLDKFNPQPFKMDGPDVPDKLSTADYRAFKLVLGTAMMPYVETKDTRLRDHMKPNLRWLRDMARQRGERISWDGEIVHIPTPLLFEIIHRHFAEIYDGHRPRLGDMRVMLSFSHPTVWSRVIESDFIIEDEAVEGPKMERLFQSPTVPQYMNIVATTFGREAKRYMEEHMKVEFNSIADSVAWHRGLISDIIHKTVSR